MRRLNVQRGRGMSGSGAAGDKDLQEVHEGFGPVEEAALAARLDQFLLMHEIDMSGVLTREMAESLKSASREVHRRQPTGPGLRSRSLAEAQKRGVDLHLLRLAQRSRWNQAHDLLRGESFVPGEITVRSPESLLELPPMVEPPAGSTTVFGPPFSDGWERVAITEATGDGQIIGFASYLDSQWGRVGTRMSGENRSAGDSDRINLFHLCGFIVPFTMPLTGALHVSAEFTCLVCRHSVKTSDEWGWSDFFAFTQTGVKCDVLWERNDGVPATEDFRQRFVPGLDASGDGESYPGTQVMVGPGERRSVNFSTNVAFPAGKTVWIFVGMSDFLYARLNDVSIDISMDTAWQLSSLAVTTL